MGGGFAMVALLCGLGQVPGLQGRADVPALEREQATPWLGWQASARLPGLGLPLLLESQRPVAAEPQQRAGRGLSLGYLFATDQAALSLRAGYRYGLPMDVPELRVDDTLVLTSGGTLKVSVGTIAWLQVDLEAFRELAGARVLRLDAVPGVRVALGPVEAGAGVVVSTKLERGKVRNCAAGLLHLGGRF